MSTEIQTEPTWRVVTNGYIYSLEYRSAFDGEWIRTKDLYALKENAEKACEILNGRTTPVEPQWRPV